MRLSVRDLRAVWLLLTAALLACSAPLLAATQDEVDVRVLIDISGSMRQNDPNNLRRPALRMLAGLLQPGTRAGVWTFARWVNNLVPVADVDAAWKTRTRSLSEQINSPGQFTNIEDVLDKASSNWAGEPTTHMRHLVLLTDGMVDVSKNADENDQSRARILDTLLPRLKAAGVKVHTIALSERADHELMQRLAGETGGWYQQVAQADELQRAFLRMFETLGRPDALPLQDNRFVVDSSVSEATVLVFSKPDSPAVRLRSPSGEEFTDSDLTAGVAWSHDQGYDLITIGSPEKGEWSLQADLDPDNRVMIVTDLRLQTSDVPSHIAVGEQVRIEAYLSNRGEAVTRPAFLRLLQVHADEVAARGGRPLDLNDSGTGDDETAGDGRYTMRYGDSQVRDAIELVLAVDSPTFMREKRVRVAIHEPVEGAVEETADGPVMTIDVQPAVMQDGAGIEVWQEGEGARHSPLQPLRAGSGQWRAALLDAGLPVYVKVSGTTRLGNLIERTVGPFVAAGVELSAPAVIAAAPAATPVVEVAPAPEPAPQVQQEPAHAAAAAVEPPAPPAVGGEEGGWLVPLIVFGAFNLTLLIGGATWWLLLRRRRAGAGGELDLDQLLADTAEGSPAADMEPAREKAA
ncbi:MAG: VWA domain-containing protein [Chromatiaceae bacterium]|nr:VWA domain-containing protein [Chromatiaceae bacterium]